MSLVLDSSATMANVYVDEMTSAVGRVYEQIDQQGAWVPSLWRLEVANSLLMGIRRGRCDEAFRDATLADLLALRIEVDEETDDFAWTSVLELAAKHRLTMYDAVYLELAIRRNLPLATLDQTLRKAASFEGVGLLGLD